MNKIFKAAAYVLLILTLTACSDEVYTALISSEPKAMSLWYNNEKTPGNVTISVDPSEHTATLHVKSQNTHWSISNSANWVTLSSTEGNADKDIEVSIASNPSFVNSRVAVLTFSSKESDYLIVRTFTISQTSRTPYLNVSQNLATLDAKAQLISISVDSNVDWTCESNKSWLAAKRDGSNLIISATENSESSRSANIVLQANFDGTTTTLATIEINQTTANVVVGDKINFGPDADSTTTSISSDVSWSINMTSDLSSWLTVSPMTGKGGNVNLTVSASTNYNDSPRSGVIEIMIGGQVKNTLPVEQAIHQVDLSATSIIVDFEGGSKDLTVVSNCPWKAQCSESWISSNVNKGDAGTTIISALIPAYECDNGRKGKIDITTADGNKVLATIDITQTGYNFVDIVCNSVLTDSRQATITVDLSSNTDWTVDSNVEWLDVKPASGNGNAQLSISVDDNPHVSERTGEVQFKAGYDSKTISFIQPGRKLELSVSELIFGIAGGTSQAVIVTTDGTFKVVTSEDWITTTINNNTIIFDAEPNRNIDYRTCEITVSLTDLDEDESLIRKIEVRQDGYVIETSPYSLDFESDGGEYELQIMSNTAWMVVASDDWLNISQTTGEVGASTINVVANPATSDETRTAKIEFFAQPDNIKIDKATVTATQAKPYLNISGNVNLTNSLSTDFKITIDSNTAWIATLDNDAEWITISSTQGKGSSEIQVFVSENTSTQERSATITVQTNTIERSLIIRQPGKTLNVNASSIKFGKQGGTSEPITVTSEGAYTISSTELWVQITQNDNTFTVTADEYSDVGIRSCDIIVTLAGLPEGESMEWIISVTQIGELHSIIIDGYENDEDWNP